MSRFRVGLAAASLFVGASPAWAAEQAVCHLQQFGEMDVSTTGGGITVEALINGQPVRLILDTGSEATILYRSTAERLGLKWSSGGQITLYGVGGSTALGEARLKDFSVAGATIHNFNIAVAGQIHDPSAQGVLGARFLLQGDMEFDLAHGKVRFLKPKDCNGDQVVYWGGSYAVTPMLDGHDRKEIEVRVIVNGRPVRALMDSGADLSTLTSTAAERVGAKAFSPDSIPGQGAEGFAGVKLTSRAKIFPSFSFGDETIKNARIEIADLFSGDEETPIGSIVPQAVIDFPEMLLGADFFRSHRIYVARSQKKVYASYIGGPVFKLRETSAAPK